MTLPSSGREPAFCFMMVVWGERYRRYFTDYCLPSLLAPNNIPAIGNKADSRFAIATTAADWAALNELAVFRRLRSHIEPVFLELPPFGEADSKMLVMSSGHKKLSNYAFESGSFGVNINPDSIYSDHTVGALQQSARKGIKMVLYPGVRFEFEGVVRELKAASKLDDPTVIDVSPRAAAGIGIRNPHPFTIACHWDSDCFFEFPVYHYIVDDAKTVMVFHTISMGPIMLDYGAITVHRDEIFEKWTLDGDYAHSNFGHFNIDTEMEYVDDSDTFMVLGFTPEAEDNMVPVPVSRFPSRSLNKGMSLWRVYTDPVTDPLKKRLFLRQIVLHEDDLGDTWRRLAQRDRRILERYVLPGVTDTDILAYDRRYLRVQAGRPVLPLSPRLMHDVERGFHAAGLKAAYKAVALRHRLARVGRRVGSYGRVLALAAMLDKTELARIARRIRIIVQSVTGTRDTGAK
jgi:hypothetical protein